MANVTRILCGSALLSVVAGAGAATAQWTELHRHSLGGSGGWDLLAVDASSRHVFVTRGEHLMVADIETGKVVGDIAGLKRAHGVALLSSKKRGYVSSGGDDRVVAFDMETLKPVADIAVGKNPDAMLFDQASGHVFVFNGRGNSASVIDPATNKVVATIDVPGKPELAVSDGAGKVFVNLEDKNQVAQIDSKTNKAVGTWTLGSCEEPTGLAIDTKHKRLFSVCVRRAHCHGLQFQ
jgi:YVTN family beta-propeller protein